MFAQQHELKEIIQEVNYSSKGDSNINRENIANTGNKIVPNPKPEKRVNPEATRAERQITKYSIKLRIKEINDIC
jgi:hypothetical protein